MTGSVALDVVIGLVFIYLIYSLLASIIQEMIANFLGLRARNLRHGISRMLEDETATERNNIFSQAIVDSKERIDRNFSIKKPNNLITAFYEQPVVKYLASGKFFSKPSYIHKSDFSKAVMEILKKHGGPNDSTVEKIRNALSNNSELIGNETRGYMLSLMDDAQNDLVRFKLNLEDWFNNTMNRVSGWYKRTIQAILLFIGFGIAVIFNVNTIDIVKILADDKEARDSMVELAANYVEENEKIIALYQEEKEEKQETSVESNLLAKGSDKTDVTVVSKELDTANKETFNTKLDSLLRIRANLEADIEEINNVMGFRPPEDLEATLVTNALIKPSAKQKILEKDGKKYIVEFPSSFLANKTVDFYDIKEKTENKKKVVYADFQDLKYIWANFWGYLITTLAISLGAPFWFDLLSKLIRIRNSIQQDPKKDPVNPNNGQQFIVNENQRVG